MEVQDTILRTLLVTCAVYIVAIETKYVLELDDVTAAVNDKFVYTIGDQKFLQTYRIHRIVDRKTKSLPDWLSFDNSTNMLYGTPTSDDIGTYSIRMKATCIDPPNMACQEKISRSFQIRIVEPIKSAESRGRDKYRLHAWSDKHHGKYSLNLTSLTVTSAPVMDPSNIYMHGFNNLIDSASLHSSFSYSYPMPGASQSFTNSFIISPCGKSIPSLFASLLLHVPHVPSINILNSKILSFAAFLSKPLHLIALTNSTDIMLSVNMDKKHIITAGPGNIVGSLKESFELTWHVSCGEFLHVAEFGKVLQHNIDVGRITKELDTDVIAWYLYSDQPVSHRHKRQANARFRQTKTPSFSIVPSTSILEDSTFIITTEPDLTSIEFDISLSSRTLIMLSTYSEFETSIALFSSISFIVSSLFDSDSELIEITTNLVSASLLDSSMSFIDSSAFQDLSPDEFLTTSFPKFLSSSSSFESDEISSFHFDTPNFVDSLTVKESFSSIQISSQETNISSILSSTTSSEIEFRATIVTSSKPSLDKPDISTSMLTGSQDSSSTSIESLLSISPSPSVVRSSSFLSSDFDESVLSSFSSGEAPYTTLQSSTMFIPSTVFTTSSIGKALSTIPETFQSVTIIQTSSISSSISSDELSTTNNILSSFVVESSTTAVSSLTILGSSLFQSSLLSDRSIEDGIFSSTDSKFDISSIFPSLSSSFQKKSGTDMSDLSVSQLSTIEGLSSNISSTFDQSGLVTSSLLMSSSVSNSTETSSDIISITSSNIFMNESGIIVSDTDKTLLFTSFLSSDTSSTKDLSRLYTSFIQSVSDTSIERQESISLSLVLSAFESSIPSFTATQFSMQTHESTPPLSSFVDNSRSSIVDVLSESTSFQTSVTSSQLSLDSVTILTAMPSPVLFDTKITSSIDLTISTSKVLIPTVITSVFTSTDQQLPESPTAYGTEYTSMTLTSSVIETSSKVLMTSSIGIPHVPTDDPPFRQNSIDHLTIVFDKFFTYRIPANTFNDTEDGNTRNLSLSISLLYGKPIPLGAWLKFNSTSQTLYGIPLQQDIKNEDRFVERIVLIAQDSQKQTTRDVISLSYSIEVLAITHSISLELDLDFDNFHLERQNLVDVAESIAELYGNPNLKYLTFFDVRKGSVIVRWGNNSLFGSICYKDIIHDVFSRIANENGTFTAEFEDLMSQYNPVSATLDLTGPCLLPQLTPLPPFDSPVGASDNDRMWIEILLPALVVILILVIIALVLLICCRHKKPSKEPQSDKPTFLEDRRPIIFPEELEMVDPSLKPKQPLILPRDYLTETPPAVPPHGSQDPPSYRVPEIDDAIFRPTSSQTPPPPSYGNQATSEPPPYRLPPPYYNPHRANIKT